MDEESVRSYNKRVFEKLKPSVPTIGLITSSFNISDGHFGVDIAAQENSDVFSVLSGVVVFSGYSNDLGNFIVLSHEHDFLSVYLHNSTLLKKTGDLVVAGEKIALGHLFDGKSTLVFGSHTHVPSADAMILSRLFEVVN